MIERPSIELTDVSARFSARTGSFRSLKASILSSISRAKLASANSSVTGYEALRGVTLSIRAGERVGVMGSNGSGKSTLLRVVGGILTPSSGSANIRGSRTALMDISLGISPEASGRDNIFLRCLLLGLSPEQIETKMPSVIAFSGLADRINSPVRTYSSGMQVRLAFAILTIVSSEILVLDEWLSVGDQEFRLKSEQSLDDALSEASSLVMASHDQAQLEKLCSRGIVLDKGSVAFDGAITEALAMHFGTDGRP